MKDNREEPSVPEPEPFSNLADITVQASQTVKEALIGQDDWATASISANTIELGITKPIETLFHTTNDEFELAVENALEKNFLPEEITVVKGGIYTVLTAYNLSLDSTLLRKLNKQNFKPLSYNTLWDEFILQTQQSARPIPQDKLPNLSVLVAQIKERSKEQETLRFQHHLVGLNMNFLLLAKLLKKEL